MKIINKVHKKIKVTNCNQYDVLVQFMVQNPKFATYRMVTITIAKDRIVYNRLWEQLKEQLNARGPPIRTIQGWKKVWVDYKHSIKKKCYLKQKYDRIRRDGETAFYKIVNFSANEKAVKKLVFDSSFNRRIFSDSLSDHPSEMDPISTTNLHVEEEPPTIKAELVDMFIDVSDDVQFTDIISPQASPVNDDVSSTSSQSNHQLNFLEEYKEIDKQLVKLKKEKVGILRQSAELKQKLQEQLQQLKQRKFEVKCQQFKYKSQKLELKRKELQMKEDGIKLRDSINCSCRKS